MADSRLPIHLSTELCGVSGADMADFKTPYSQQSNAEFLWGSKDRSSWGGLGENTCLNGHLWRCPGRRRQSRVGPLGRLGVSFLPPSVNLKWQGL